MLEVEQREKGDCLSTKAPHMQRTATIYKPLDIYVTYLHYLDMRTTAPTPSKASGDLDLGPLPLVSGFMFLSPTSLCHGKFTSGVPLHKPSWASSATQIPRYRSRLLTTLGFACHGFLSRLSYLRCPYPHPHPQHQENRHIC